MTTATRALPEPQERLLHIILALCKQDSTGKVPIKRLLDRLVDDDHKAWQGGLTPELEADLVALDRRGFVIFTANPHLIPTPRGLELAEALDRRAS